MAIDVSHGPEGGFHFLQKQQPAAAGDAPCKDICEALVGKQNHVGIKSEWDSVGPNTVQSSVFWGGSGSSES